MTQPETDFTDFASEYETICETILSREIKQGLRWGWLVKKRGVTN
jgi:hypothetical protein